jgi:hypothetical protein
LPSIRLYFGLQMSSSLIFPSLSPYFCTQASEVYGTLDKNS